MPAHLKQSLNYDVAFVVSTVAYLHSWFEQYQLNVY